MKKKLKDPMDNNISKGYMKYVIITFLMIYDIVAMNFSYFAALWLRFDCRFSTIPYNYLNSWMNFVPLYTLLSIMVFWLLRLYNGFWKNPGYSEFLRAALASLITGTLHTILITVLFERMPISYYLVGLGIQAVLVIIVRFSYRIISIEYDKYKRLRDFGTRVMLIGAGAAGRMVLNELQHSKELNAKVCCIIDDDPNKWGLFISGVKIVGGRDEILRQVELNRIEKIMIAMPSASAAAIRDILDICKETSCELKTLPGIYQFVSGTVSVSAMKDVSIENLLGREPIKTNMDEIFRYISGKVILVTGGGGSIGSELCRQIAAHNPKKLIIFDVYENNAYSIQLELKDKYPHLPLEVLIGSVRDSRRIYDVFAEYKPDVVYHAAAHKHVPLMEDSPCESIKNNVIGTYKTAYAAMCNGCKRFVLISTDKAVNPTNIMGASKRLCEMVIQTFDRMIRDGREAELPALFSHEKDEIDVIKSNIGLMKKHPVTEYVAVRFGNVLGSNGSVIPIFKKQIEKGGPITVTHPDIIRYFMTIPEATSLVLQAGTYASGGEIFVLDMGEPVKIDTLARNLIKLSGLRPDVDIKIEYTGLRPGEKLYEEKLMSEEGLRCTPNRLIHIGNPIPFDYNAFVFQLEELMNASYNNDKNIRRLVQRIVPTYHPADNCPVSVVGSNVSNAGITDKSDKKEKELAAV